MLSVTFYNCALTFQRTSLRTSSPWTALVPTIPFAHGQRRGLTVSLPVRYQTTVNPPYRVLFFGTDRFSCEILQSLVQCTQSPESTVSVLDVVTVGDHYVGKGRQTLWESPLKRVAQTLGLATHFVESTDKRMAEWQLPQPNNSILTSPSQTHYDLGIVASFGSFIPARIIEAFPQGIFNVHPSLLPKYRGAAPLQWALLNKEHETGVTLQELHKKTIDAGRIINQRPLPIQPTDTFEELLTKAARLGGDMVRQFLTDVPRYLAEARLQDTSQVTKAPKLRTEASRIHWSRHTTADVNAMHRVFGPRQPIHTYFGLGKRLHKISIVDFRLTTLPLPPELNQGRAPVPGVIYFGTQRPVPQLIVPLADNGFITITRARTQAHGELTADQLRQMFQFRNAQTAFLDP
ncbi:Methionyl-tRNA formyltransferase [Dispira simplex]|nr:Methionyl-tRNA formyltransferase [Dispira simplex]